MSREVTAEVFLKDIANHSMTVGLDSGVYRHLRFSQPQNSHLWFELVTWPGCLTIHGDMGTWTFSRVNDMFEFFREDTLKINPSYWAEKVQAGAFGGWNTCKEFSLDLFKQQVIDRLDGWDLDPDQRTEVLDELADEVFSQDYEAPHAFYAALYEFKSNGVSFDCEIPDGETYTYHFLWCLYAIVWGIHQYSKASIPLIAGRE